MAVTLKEISEWLNNLDTNHELEDDVIKMVFGYGDYKTHNFIRTSEEGKMFKWALKIDVGGDGFLNIKDHKYQALVLSHMLYLNYNTKFGTWEHDPSDGDLSVVVEIPLEDALMTEKQFKRINGFMEQNASDGAEEILAILETGKLPEKEEGADISSDEMLALLSGMLERLKEETSEASSEDGI